MPASDQPDASLTVFRNSSGEPLSRETMEALYAIFGKGHIQFTLTDRQIAPNKFLASDATFRTSELIAHLKNPEHGMRLRQLLSFGDASTSFTLKDGGKEAENAFHYINRVVPKAEEVGITEHPDDRRAREIAAADAVVTKIVAPKVPTQQVRVRHWSQAGFLRGLDARTEHLDPKGRPTTVGRRLQDRATARTSQAKRDAARGDSLTVFLAPEGRSFDMGLARRIAKEHRLDFEPVREDKVRPGEKTPRVVGVAFHTKPFDQALKNSDNSLLRWQLLRAAALTRQGQKDKPGLIAFVTKEGQETRREDGITIERYISERAGPIVTDPKKELWTAQITVPQRPGSEREMDKDVVEALLAIEGAEKTTQRVTATAYQDIPGGGRKKVIGEAHEIVTGVNVPAMSFRQKLYTDPEFAAFMREAHNLMVGNWKDGTKDAIDAEISSTETLPGSAARGGRETFDAKALRAKRQREVAQGFQVSEIDHKGKLHYSPNLLAYVKTIEEEGPDAPIGEEQDIKRTWVSPRGMDRVAWPMAIGLTLAVAGTGLFAICRSKEAADNMKKQLPNYDTIIDDLQGEPTPPAAPVEGHPSSGLYPAGDDGIPHAVKELTRRVAKAGDHERDV